jgi:hypothetical protein
LKLPPGCGKPVTEMDAWILRHHVIRYFNSRNGGSRRLLSGGSSD